MTVARCQLVSIVRSPMPTNWVSRVFTCTLRDTTLDIFSAGPFRISRENLTPPALRVPEYLIAVTYVEEKR